MASLFGDELSGAFQEMEETFGDQVVYWQNVEYVCTVDPTTRAVSINALGNPATIHTRVWIRLDLFAVGAEKPQFGKLLRLNGIPLQVKMSQIRGGSVLELELEDPAGRRHLS